MDVDKKNRFKVNRFLVMYLLLDHAGSRKQTNQKH